MRGEAQPLDLRTAVRGGALFYAIEDYGRVEAFIPPAGAENHAANLLAAPNGDLLCAWFAGLMEGYANVRIALARLPAGANAWGAPVWVSGDATRSEQNPILFQAPGGPLWLLYTAQQTRGCTREEWRRRVAAGEAQGGYAMQWTATIRRRLSWDGGQTWGPVETFADQPGSFCRQPPLVLSSGAWLFPMYYSLQDAQGAHSGDYTAIWRSTDGGASWEEVVMPASRGRVHASLVELAPGQIAAFMRSRAADRIYRSVSADDGRTWSPPERTALPNNNASIQAVRLQSGEVAMAYNAWHAGNDATATVWPPRRYPLTVALSEDGGETWPFRRHVDMGDGFCGEANESLNRTLAYPSLIQTPDGLLHLAYSYRQREGIKYVRFGVDWIRSAQDRLYGSVAEDVGLA